MEEAALVLPLAVAIPLAAGSLMLATAHLLPKKIPDAISLAATLAVGALCAWLAVRSADAPLLQWLGGWHPAQGIALGIGLAADPASAAMATLAALIVASSLIFAWGFFDEVHAHFHVLMLLFLTAMVGFCLTRDLFNLFVWFELMSVAAYALTAYELGASPLEGGLNFTIVNTFGSILLLAGVGLLYARAGQLDFDAVSAAICTRGSDPVAAAAFCLIASALLTKAAVVPFQAWLPDAHGVAPSPVSVVFSAIMVPLGMFGLAKVGWQIFGDCGFQHALLRDLLLPLGAATAVVGALLAWLQRHLKRLLGFSTIAHMGIVLIGATSGQARGVAGLLVYITGHALVKGSLFMLAGVLLALESSNDEIDLRGRGKRLRMASVLMVLAALLLAGAPWGIMHGGDDLIDSAAQTLLPGWARAATIFGAAVTGGAVLRAAGRIFVGLGARAGLEAESPTEPAHEKANRSMWLMLGPCAALLLLDLCPGSLVVPAALTQGARLAHLPSQTAPGEFVGIAWGAVSVAAALVLAGVALFRDRFPAALLRCLDWLARAVRPLRDLHSGLVTDYVVWAAVGLCGLVATVMLA